MTLVCPMVRVQYEVEVAHSEKEGKEKLKESESKRAANLKAKVALTIVLIGR